MSKNAKQYAQEMLKMSTSTEGRKEVVNACLFVLKALSESRDIDPKDIEKLAGGVATTIPCPGTPRCITVNCQSSVDSPFCR